jgi:hypothetical protein
MSHGAGFAADPDSSTDVRLFDSVIDTGDDGISIKSGNCSAQEMAARAGRGIHGTRQNIQRPAKNIHIYRTKVLSRNFCLGSATYGGIFNLLMEDCEIGDDEGSASWAIKYKSHQAYAGALVNHTYRRIKVGKLGATAHTAPHGHTGYFISVELRYHPLIPNRTCHVNMETLEGDCPIFQDIAFQDISVAGAASAGSIAGFEGDLLRGLTFSNVTFAPRPKQAWSCGYVDLSSFAARNVQPPLSCKSGPASAPSAACAAALSGSGCPHGPGVRGCRKCLGCRAPDRGGCSGARSEGAGCTAADIEGWCSSGSS